MNRRRLERYLPVLGYLGLAGLILGPALGRGYLLQYDMVFSPFPSFDWAALASGSVPANQLPVQLLLAGLGRLIPMDIVQKVVLLVVLSGAGYAMYRAAPTRMQTARLLAGLIYMINPYVYTRLMAGHWLLLAAYAVTPLVLVAFQRFLAAPAPRPLALAALAWAGVGLLNPHHLIIAGLLYAGLALFWVRSWRTAGYALGEVAAAASLSSWWLVPLLLGPNITQTITLSQWYAFATLPDPQYGLLAAMLSLQGFWHQGWLQVSSFSWWPLLWLAATAPAWTGLAVVWRPRSPQAKTLAGLGVASLAALILAAGPAPATAGLDGWIFLHVPGFSGLREPHKVLAILALFYAYAAASGLGLLQARWRRLMLPVAAVSALAVAALSWPLWWAAHGQLRPVDYPAAWYQFHSYLQQHPDQTRILVLPWQPYLEGTFAGSLVASPAASFFGPRTVANEALNLPGVISAGSPHYPAIDRLISSRDPAVWQAELARQNIHYILVLRSYDSVDLSFLQPSGLVTPLLSDPETAIFVLTNSR